MKLRRISIISICVLSLVFTLCGCSKSEPAGNSTNTTNTNNKPAINIGVCMGDAGEYYNQILQGFNAGITDYFTENNVVLNVQTADEANTTDAICSGFISGNVPLIFTLGENSLMSAHNQTTTIPIVSTGVMDYERVLNIQKEQPESKKDSKDNNKEDNKEWDGITKMNITGVSSVPNMADVLSLMIEATPDITSVGILFNPNDPDSIYQNHILEKYLIQAGIQYREYEFHAPDISSSEAREIADLACRESSVLFIPAESSVNEYQDTIKKVALDYSIPTVGGDEYIGNRTLVSMYNDPFDQGYEAAKTAYEILINDKKPDNIAVKKCNTEAEQKLFDREISEKLDRHFPKSFKERDEFLATYKIGSKTKRVEKEQ